MKKTIQFFLFLSVLFSSANTTFCQTLIVDDGTAESQIGDGGQFIWMNRFTPPPADFPLRIDEVSIVFATTAFTDPTNVGDPIEIFIWEDTDNDGDPGTGTTLVYNFNSTVQFNDGITFSVYALPGAPIHYGSGDLIIGVVNRVGFEGFNDFPAALDRTASQGRSWAATYLAGDVPANPTLPGDEQWGTIDFFGFSGNWMIRASYTGNINITPTISQTDEDGDGNPDILDPCACGDPLNIIDGGGNITHFHDFVTINSAPGEVWRLTNINSGQMLTNALAPIPVGIIIPEVAPGVYHLDLWHPTGVGFNADFNRDVNPLAVPLTTGGTCNAAICGPQAIPTMGQWGLIILSLLLLSFASVFMMNRQTALAGYGTVTSNGSGIPFNKAAFGKMLMAVMAGLAVVFTTAVVGFGYEMTAADVPGSLIAGPIMAYLLHLLVTEKKDS